MTGSATLFLQCTIVGLRSIFSFLCCFFFVCVAWLLCSGECIFVFVCGVIIGGFLLFVFGMERIIFCR